MRRKPCQKYRPETIERYGHGPLSEWRSLWMQIHFKRCEDCRLRWVDSLRLPDADQENAAFARYWAEHSYHPAALNNSLRERLWERIMTEPAPPAPAPPTQTRPALPVARRWAIGGVAAAAITLGAGMYFLPGTPVLPTPAFARVEEAMANVQNATWTETYRYPQNRNQEQWETRHTVWASIPLARLTRQQTAGPPRTTLSTSYWDGEYMTFFSPKDWIYNRYRLPHFMEGLAGKTSRERIRDLILFPRDENFLKARQTQEADSHTRYHDRRTSWTAHTETWNGQKVIRFESRLMRETLRTEPHPFRDTQASQWKIWADAKTYRILRREVRYPPKRRGDSESVRISENFRYNVTPPRDVFNLPVPPVGRPYQYHGTAPRRPIVRKTKTSVTTVYTSVTPDEEARIRAVLRKAVEAWNRRDSVAFAALWDFRYGEKMASLLYKRPVNEEKVRAEERKRITMMKQGTPFRTWPMDAIADLQAWPSLYMRRKESDPFPPSPETYPESYLATTRGIVLNPRPGTTIGASHMFLLRRRGNDLRLTYMDISLPERSAKTKSPTVRKRRSESR
jgi:hypothetical protein